MNDGIYRFVGGGPATTRLRISARLPFRTAQLLAVAAGTQKGDPIYLLGRGTQGPVHGHLYRSTDGGQSWQEEGTAALLSLSR